MYIRRIVYSNIVSEVDQERHMDRSMTETQVGYSDTAGLLGVISEVALCVHISLVADNLDGALVGTNGTIGTQAPELAGDGAFRGDVQGLFLRQGGVGHIIHNAYGEVVFGFSSLQVVEHSQSIARIEFLGTHAVTAADDQRTVSLVVVDVPDIQVQRFAVGASFLGPVQNSNPFYGCRHGLEEMFGGERTIQMYVQHADFFALSVQDLGNFFHGLSAGAHDYYNVFSIGSTGVVEQLVVTAGQLADFVHVIFYDFRQGFVVFVYSFTGLEVNIRVLVGTTDYRMIRVQRIFTEFLQFIVINQFFQFIIVQQFDLLDFVRSTEPIEEVQERHMAFDGRQVSNCGQVHNFLNAAFCQHGKAGLTAGHNVTVVTEDVQRAGSQSSGCNVEYGGQQFASDFVHVRDHQQQPLGCSVGRGQSTGSQRAVHSTGSTCFRLHFHDLYRAIENVLLAMRSPFITCFCHRRRRSDRVDRCNFRKRIRSICGRGVAIHCLHFFHLNSPSF